jgi:UDP-galactopyranose mutase
MSYDAIVVGAGFAGSVLAERMASQCGMEVLVVERREHVAGNAYDEYNEHGVLVPRFGGHLFHTNADKVVDHLSQFTDWRPYEHRVRALINGRSLPLPLNRDTINGFFSLDLETEAEVEAFLATIVEPHERVDNSEQAVVSKVGRALYDAIFRCYTRKHWGLDPSELDPTVCGRIPLRLNTDDRYFSDGFQAMPREGFTAMFERMLDHPGIDVRLGTSWQEIDEPAPLLIWTGPIDEYFGHRFGPLPYRSLRFEHVTYPTPGGRFLQPVGTINYPDERIPFIRVEEFRHMYGQVHDHSTLAYNIPCADGDPYYPIPRPENRELYNRYKALAEELPAVVFVGRLARYQYLNMDQVVAQALATFNRLVEDGRLRPRPKHSALAPR